jgi:hypothetical protein
MVRFISILLLCAGLFVACPNSTFAHCPFCTAQSQTLTEEMDSMDTVVLAKLIATPPAASDLPEGVSSKGKFEIIENLKAPEWGKPEEIIQVLYYGDAPVGTTMLVMGVVEGKKEKKPVVIWSTPIIATNRVREYLSHLSKLPKSGAERLEFFQKHLEDKEELLARDSYDEFAKAPYEEVIALKPKMNHDQLVSWVRNEDIPASRRRLYLTMLGICGNANDLPMLEEMIQSNQRGRRAGLDALIACYLTLKGSPGLPLIEELFFKNKKAEYSDVNSAIMAIRFHGTESTVIPTKDLIPVLRHLLDRPELADLVIPDLARWEDWESLDRLMELFKSADTKSTWVREPIINFVKVCPLPEAKEKFKELEALDPAAVKRASRFLPFGPPKAPADTKQTSDNNTSNDAEQAVADTAVPAPAVAKASAANATLVSEAKPGVVTSANVGTKPAEAARPKFRPVANRWLLWSVTVGAGLFLTAVQWSVLKAGRPAPRRK